MMNRKPMTIPTMLAEEPDQTDWELLRRMTDDEAETRAAADRDAPPTDLVFWRTAKMSFADGESGISGG